MKKLTAVFLIPLFLASGCGGGGTSGAGGGGAVTAGEYVLFATLAIDGSISMDSLINICDADADPPVLEPLIPTRTGTFTITVTNATSLTQDLFPDGIIINSYTTAFTRLNPASSGIPALEERRYHNVHSIPNSESITVTVNIMDLGGSLPEYVEKRYGTGLFPDPELTLHPPDNYSVTVTVKGRTLSGHGFTLSASTVIEVGNFNRCDE